MFPLSAGRIVILLFSFRDLNAALSPGVVFGLGGIVFFIDLAIEARTCSIFSGFSEHSRRKVLEALSIHKLNGKTINQDRGLQISKMWLDLVTPARESSAKKSHL